LSWQNTANRPSITGYHRTQSLATLFLSNQLSECRANLFSRWHRVRVHNTTATLLDANYFITGKRIALPTRVEPKVYFANERTFLSWLNFTVILGALAVGMLNFGDFPAFVSSILFTVVALGSMIYSLRTFWWRASQIAQRGQSGFDDKIGPTVLCIFLGLAVIVNFALRFIYPSNDLKH
jgi:uncharacterized membrane protein YidH (DUF202 family)